ncbi:MAG TPA: ankyrin repeat domain-containing protein [Candidatus Polarisedimenticolaceae bacterium]|nr:ankyrin repeat domain-containing protein [Candidatus Polarisedimenticolaceae bacterium]
MTAEEFIEACKDGRLDVVRTALDAGMDANASVPYDDGERQVPIPALYFAAVGNHLDVVRLLLDRGANPNDGESVFHAAELNLRDCLELLVARGADISNACAAYGNTPLYFLSGYHPTVPNAPTVALGMRWLLEHGADPNVTSGKDRATPLQQCAQNGWTEVVSMLLEHGADPAQKRADGRTAYALAVRGGHREVAALLPASELHPVDELIGACSRGDETAARAVLAKHTGIIASFTHADRHTVSQTASSGNAAAIRTMKAVGFDLAWESTWAGTALHHAAWHGNVAMTRLLIELGAPINVRDRRFGSSPLGWAAHGSKNCRAADEDYLAIVRALLDAGADRASSINRWNEPADKLGSEKVDAFLEAWWRC